MSVAKEEKTEGSCAVPPGSARVAASAWPPGSVPKGTVDGSCLTHQTFGNKYLN